MITIGIFGPKLSGKTTLAMELARQHFSKLKMRSLVLDPNGDEWGEHAWSTMDEEKFWSEVWSKQNRLIIVDEAAETINRDKELIPVFTRMRHLGHRFIVIGHSGVNLLPIMREQIDTLYLFRQNKKAAQVWAELFTQDELLNAMHLNQYEFIHTKLYGKAKKQMLKL